MNDQVKELKTLIQMVIDEKESVIVMNQLSRVEADYIDGFCGVMSILLNAKRSSDMLAKKLNQAK